MSNFKNPNLLEEDSNIEQFENMSSNDQGEFGEYDSETDDQY